MNSYLLFKSLHLIAVVSWMAGLLYLPRIFVYHVENKEKKNCNRCFWGYGEKIVFLYYASSYGAYMDFWININLSKWHWDFLSIMDANKDYIGNFAVSI